jgi:hypothetical protein
MTDRSAACKQKARYPGYGPAQARAIVQNRTNGQNNVKPYLCPICAGYHLTSRTAVPADPPHAEGGGE